MREPVDLAQHAIGEDAVQVERHDDRHVRAECGGSLRAVAFRIGLALGAHRAVQRDVERVDAARMRRYRRQQFAVQPPPVLGRQDAGAARSRRHGRHELDVGAGLENAQRAADRGVEAALAKIASPCSMAKSS